MADKESQAQLSARLAAAARKVTVGARYQHYKHQTYTVLTLALREEDNEPCVVYQAEYDNRLTFIRTAANWIETIRVGGKTVNRFRQLP